MAWLAVVSAVVISATSVAPVGGGNALTLPAQRHLVYVDVGDPQPIWLLALQQSGSEGRGLSFFRSDDDGRNWSFYLPIQADGSHTDRADLKVVGRDIALTYSWEGPKLTGSSAHDVYFQWWRHQPGTRDFSPESPVRVFDSTSPATAYSRAEIAQDSLGRLWIQAFRLEDGGRSRAVIAVSVDGGRTFSEQPFLDLLNRRGGGRLLSLGDRLIFLYGMHDGFVPARYRIRFDLDPLERWDDSVEAFPEGIYHGAALSAVATSSGGMHLAYKDENEQLYYRHFDGQQFGPKQLVDGTPDWALQPAITLQGDRLLIFYNHKLSSTNYRIEVRTLQDGLLSAPQILDQRVSFKGYLSSAERMPEVRSDGLLSMVPCFYGEAPTAANRGHVMVVQSGVLSSAPDAGVLLGAADAGAASVLSDSGLAMPDAGSAASFDAGMPFLPGTETLLFGDDFTRSTGLGAEWAIHQGLWVTDGRAISDLRGGDLATSNRAHCGDCRVQTVLNGFGVPEAGVLLRAAGNSRYELVLRSTGTVQLRRVRGSTVDILGEQPSGLASLSEPATFSLAALGSSPVRLVAKVNGIERIRVTDASHLAISGSGQAGLWTTNAGVWFDAFRVYGSTLPDLR